MDEFEFSKPAALRIARLGDDQYRNALKEKFLYPEPGWAEGTHRGAKRLFNAADILTLCIFARLIDLGVLARNAGFIASEIARVAREAEEEDRVVYVKGMLGTSITLAGSMRDKDHADGTGRAGLGEILLDLSVPVGAMRSMIAREIETERKILGRRS